MKKGTTKWTDQMKVKMFYDYLNNEITYSELGEKYELAKPTVVRYIHEVLNRGLVCDQDAGKGKEKIDSRRPKSQKPGGNRPSNPSEKERKRRKVKGKEDVQDAQWSEWAKSMGML